MQEVAFERRRKRKMLRGEKEGGVPGTMEGEKRREMVKQRQ